MRPFTIAMIAAVLGCGAEPAATISPSPPATAVPSPAVADPCDVHRAAFRAAIASATGVCSSDQECGCFNPVVEEAGCGGITDAATAARLAAIETAFHRDGCPWPHLCGPWSCTPVCREGRCINGGSGGIVTPPL